MILRKQVETLSAISNVHTEALDNLTASNRMLAAELDDAIGRIDGLRQELDALKQDRAASELGH